jgi:hypothetical protein
VIDVHEAITQATLVNDSLVSIYSAMFVYALAFIFFTYDLAKRISQARQLDAIPEVEAVEAKRVGKNAGGTTVLDRPAGPVPPGYEVKANKREKRSLSSRLGMVFTVMAWILHVGGTVLRGLAAGRVPWANMFEFTLTATAIIIGVFLIIQFWQDLQFLGAYVTGFVLVFLGVATTNFYVDVIPLPPALQSYWLVIHVFVASLGTGFYGLGAGLSVVQRKDCARCQRFRPPRSSSRSPTVSWSSDSSSGRSPSSPVPSGPSTPGDATGAGTPKRSGHSSSGSSSPGTSTLERHADGADRDRRRWRSSASRLCSSTSRS